MRLRAEMKLPGKAWLEFKSEPQDGKTLFTVTAYFAPHGLFGFLYWYAMWLLHRSSLMGSPAACIRARVLLMPMHCIGITMDKLILVTGATGYIASRLIPRLLDSGYRVRCLARDPLRLKGRSWFRHVEVIQADVTTPVNSCTRA